MRANRSGFDTLRTQPKQLSKACKKQPTPQKKRLTARSNGRLRLIASFLATKSNRRLRLTGFPKERATAKETAYGSPLYNR
jgi:hypothetical protein